MNVPTERRVALLLAEILGLSSEQLGPTSSPDTISSWDSVANLGFLGAVEEEFGVTIHTAEALGVRSLGDVVALLRKKGVAEKS